jgi:quinol monooxygenase YgiN
MVITILEGRVEQIRGADLRQAFDAGRTHLPEGLVESYLIQSRADAENWRIISVWASHEALAQMQRTEQVPGGVRMFRAAGAEPTLTVFNVAGRLLGEGADFDAD